MEVVQHLLPFRDISPTFTLGMTDDAAPVVDRDHSHQYRQLWETVDHNHSSDSRELPSRLIRSVDLVYAAETSASFFHYCCPCMRLLLFASTLPPRIACLGLTCMMMATPGTISWLERFSPPQVRILTSASY